MQVIQSHGDLADSSSEQTSAEYWINDLDILFVDAKTGALDTKSTKEIMAFLAGINKDGTTVMLVTQDVKVSARW